MSDNELEKANRTDAQINTAEVEAVQERYHDIFQDPQKICLQAGIEMILCVIEIGYFIQSLSGG